jgi:hypothetical protein
VEVQLHASLTSALGGGEWSASRPGRFTPGERVTGTHWIGSWVGFRAVLDAVMKRKIPSPCRDLNPHHPARSQALYHWAMPAPCTYTIVADKRPCLTGLIEYVLCVPPFIYVKTYIEKRLIYCTLTLYTRQWAVATERRYVMIQV